MSDDPNPAERVPPRGWRRAVIVLVLLNLGLLGISYLTGTSDRMVGTRKAMRDAKVPETGTMMISGAVCQAMEKYGWVACILLLMAAGLAKVGAFDPLLKPLTVLLVLTAVGLGALAVLTYLSPTILLHQLHEKGIRTGLPGGLGR